MTKKAPAYVRRYDRAKSRNPRSMMVKLPGSGVIRSSTFTSCILPSETWINEGMLPRRSICVCTAGETGGKPHGIPTMPEMIFEALKDAKARGLRGLEAKDIAQFIATKW